MVAPNTSPRHLAPDKKLTPAQHDHFFREGYLVLDNVFDRADLTPLRRELEAQIDARAAELHAAGQLANLHADEPLERRVTRIYRDSKENGEDLMRYLEGYHGGGQRGAEMFNLILQPKLLAVLTGLIGAEIVGSSVYRLRPKVPGVGRGVVPWHQDSGYFQDFCDQEMIITCWIPLVDATVENGCMQILPRAHRSGIATHHTGGNANFLVINDPDLPRDPRRAVTADCPLGGAVLMTNLTPHCSTPNFSDTIRWSVDLRYQSAAAPNNVGLWPAGDNQEHAAEFQAACYPPEADFVVQSPSKPESVATYRDFVQRRSAFEKAKGIAGVHRGWTPVQA